MPLRPPFVIAVLATAAIFYGADAPWFDINGFEFNGQSSPIRAAADIDTVWVYAAGGVAAFGLFVFLLFRIRAAFGLMAIAGLGAGWILVAAYDDLHKFTDLGSVAWGGWLTFGGAVALVLASLAGLRSGRTR